jgi:hypothetical protein
MKTILDVLKANGAIVFVDPGDDEIVVKRFKDSIMVSNSLVFYPLTNEGVKEALEHVEDWLNHYDEIESDELVLSLLDGDE